MERSKIKVILILNVLIFSSVLLIGQQPIGGGDFCVNSDYLFEIDGDYYPESDKVYICPSSLPVDVTLVYANSLNPVTGYTFEWKLDNNIASSTTHTVSVGDGDFGSDNKVDLQCTFNSITLKVNLNNQIWLTFNEKDKRFQYDDNNILAYKTSYSGSEKLGTPWNYIKAGDYDVLKASVNKSSGASAVNNISSNNALITVTPSGMSVDPESIRFDFTGSGQYEVQIKGCHDTDPELLLFVENPITYEVEFIQVCDSDDDVQVVQPGIIVSSSTSVCIDGGVDKTIDGMYSGKEVSGVFKSDFLKGKNVLYYESSTGKWYVHAGPAETDGAFRCRTKAHDNDPDECPGGFDVDKALVDANKILNKVGVTLKKGSVSPPYRMNYNIFKEDGALTDNKTHFPGEFSERHWIHIERGHQHIAPTDGISEVYMVDNLGPSITGIDSEVKGRGTYPGHNTLALSVILADGKVLAHELGHAKWRLEHPGGPSYIDEQGNFQNGQFGIDDLNNFMHGDAGKILNWKVRRYQFHLIN